MFSSAATFFAASASEAPPSRSSSIFSWTDVVSFLARSVDLTPEPVRRADRALAAAQAHVHAGAIDEALRLLASAEIDAGTELQQARVDLLRGKLAAIAGPG